MSSKYASPFEIPSGFPDVIKSLTREVLRHQPENVYEFAAQYFEDELNKLNNATSTSNSFVTKTTTPSQVTKDNNTSTTTTVHNAVATTTSDGLLEALRLAITSACQGETFIPVSDLQKIFSTTTDLSETDKLFFFAEADELVSGQVNVSDFLTSAAIVIQNLPSLRSLATAAKDEARFLHGLPEDIFMGLLLHLFLYLEEERQNDPSGYLHWVAESVDLGLTRREANVLRMLCPRLADGTVDLNILRGEDGAPDVNSVPVCFDRLFTKLCLVNATEPMINTTTIAEELMNALQGADLTASGSLFPEDIRTILHNSRLGLSRIQMGLLLSFGDQCESGLIQYASLPDRIAALLPLLRQADATCEGARINAEEAATFQQCMHAAFPDGTSEQLSAEGYYLPMAEFKNKLSELKQSANLTDQESAALFFAAPWIKDDSQEADELLVDTLELKGIAWLFIKYMRICAPFLSQ